MDAAQIAALDAKLASQIGDDVQRIYDHEALFKESRAAMQAQAAELERLRAALDVSDKYWRGENITPFEVILAIRAALEAKP